MTPLKQRLEEERDRAADAYTSSSYFHLEYSTFGNTARECNSAHRAGFDHALELLLPVVGAALDLRLQCANTGHYGKLGLAPGECRCSCCKLNIAIKELEAKLGEG